MKKIYGELDSHDPDDAALLDYAFKDGRADVVAADAQAVCPGHFGEDHPLRPQIDALLTGAARRLVESESQQVDN